jgi:hypothetical protein
MRFVQVRLNLAWFPALSYGLHQTNQIVAFTDLFFTLAFEGCFARPESIQKSSIDQLGQRIQFTDTGTPTFAIVPNTIHDS